MVREDKKRVMITLPRKVIKDLEVICDSYGMNKSQMISMLVVFHKERMTR